MQIWSLPSRNCFVCSTCNLRALRIYEQSILWFIGTVLLSVKRKLLSCSPRSYQAAWPLDASAYGGPEVFRDTYLGIVRPLHLPTSIVLRNFAMQRHVWLLSEWCKNCLVFVVIIVYDCIFLCIFCPWLTKHLWKM